MATKPKSTTIGLPSLELKDLITMVSTAVAITLAWGVFSTRLSLVEKELITLKEIATAQAAEIDKLHQRTAKLSSHQQEDELFIDQLYGVLKRPPPTRRATTY